MPRLSDTMEEGTISHWLKHEGDQVEKGELIAEIETDKANMEYNAFTSGTLQKILVQEGESAKIGEPIALIGEAGEAAPMQPAGTQQEGDTAGGAVDRTSREEAAEQARPSAALTPERGAQAPRPSGEVTYGEERIKASPLAKKEAEERGIDLRQVNGTGPGGRIVRDDILNFRPPGRPAAKPAPEIAAQQGPQGTSAPAAAGITAKPLSRMQQTIARRMVEAKTQIPHFYVTNEVDVEAALELRRRLNEGVEREQQVRFEAIIIRACALALRQFADVNGSYKDGQFEYHDYVNIGHAVSLPEGLVVPIVRDCDKRGIRQIDQDMRVNIEKARAGKLTPADLDRGTFSVSNMGMFDVDEFQAVVNPPNAAILAIPTAKPTPVVIDGQIVVRQRMKLTLSCDHRIVYGATGAQFLQEVKRLLQAPYSLLL